MPRMLRHLRACAARAEGRKMNARDRLMLEAVQASRNHSSAAARACAAREAKEADIAMLAKASEFEAQTLFGMRSMMIALGSAPDEARCYLAFALDVCVKALRARPTPLRGSERGEVRRYWLDGAR